MRLVALELHHAINIAKSIQTNGAVHSITVRKIAERNPLELLTGATNIANATTIYSSYKAHAAAAEKKVQGEDATHIEEDHAHEIE